MDTLSTPSAQSLGPLNSSAKRKRSPSVDASAYPAPPPKLAKTHTSHLQINYLARQYSDDLPLVVADDTLPSILTLIGDYDGVLQRHESMAGNLGARPLGPILIKRFERLFDGPPRVLKNHGKDGNSVTWLDVVEFARNKPEQFNLEKMRDGVPVCQFYTKQCRVEISEEDFVLLASGMPQKLIPPQPIMEDEEKEMGTLEILEKNLRQVVQMADQVSARARQLNHRIKNRRNAIISRREFEIMPPEDISRPSISPINDKGTLSSLSNGDQRDSASPTSGFVAVNTRTVLSQNGTAHISSEHSKNQTISVANGTSYQSASPAVHAELLSKFFTNSERAQNDQDHPRRSSVPTSRPVITSKPKPNPSSETIDYASILLNSASPVPIPNTPSSLLAYSKPSPAERFDDSGPYKAEMVSRMEQLQRGDRILPPCDRCRRLHMDCLKNLTACMGCTKKHAKCSWKDVRDEELRDETSSYVEQSNGDEELEGTNAGDEDETTMMVVDEVVRKYTPSVVDAHQGVRDEELLGEEASDDGKEMEESGKDGGGLVLAADDVVKIPQPDVDTEQLRTVGGENDVPENQAAAASSGAALRSLPDEPLARTSEQDVTTAPDDVDGLFQSLNGGGSDGDAAATSTAAEDRSRARDTDRIPDLRGLVT